MQFDATYDLLIVGRQASSSIMMKAVQHTMSSAEMHCIVSNFEVTCHT